MYCIRNMMFAFGKYDVLHTQYDVCLRQIVVSLRDDSNIKDDIRGCRPFLMVTMKIRLTRRKAYITDMQSKSQTVKNL